MTALVNDIPQSHYGEHRDDLILAFKQVREHTLDLTASLSAEDMQIQSMPDASPTKWHLAHTTWFFEAFILAKYRAGFEWHNPLYARLFNSYYNAMGEMHPRPARGMISRPGLVDVQHYREDITEKMLLLLTGCSDIDFQEIASLLVLGINHEQQHQELILTDIKHALFQNPSYPAVFDHPVSNEADRELRWIKVEGGKAGVGYAGGGFCFDNERPRHTVLLQDFEIASRLVNNTEWLEFMEDGGYEQPLLWLSDGWAWRTENSISAPLYWLKDQDGWQSYNLTGLRSLVNHEPVTHISYYEADAYARWAGHHLPTEFEWEHGILRPDTLESGPGHNSQRWEWTASPYSAYPGFQPVKGNAGEYNGKFMINQMVLRGASGATARDHSRPSYRNFFYPDARWQFFGLRPVRHSYE